MVRQSDTISAHITHDVKTKYSALVLNSGNRFLWAGHVAAQTQKPVVNYICVCLPSSGTVYT